MNNRAFIGLVAMVDVRITHSFKSTEDEDGTVITQTGLRYKRVRSGVSAVGDLWPNAGRQEVQAK